jgi:hypothetical protein
MPESAPSAAERAAALRSRRARSTTPICLRHREAALAAICKRCGAGMCDDCWAFVVGHGPACAGCVIDIERRSQRVWALFATFTLICGGAGFWLTRHVDPETAWGAIAMLALAVVVALVMAVKSARAAAVDAPAIRRRTADDASGLEAEEAGTPYRGRVGRVMRKSVPATLSTRATTMVVTATLVTSAVLVPFSLKFPRWVKVEIVLASWWLFTGGLLAALLYRGVRMREDHEFRGRWELPSLGGGTTTPRGGGSSSSGSSGWSWTDPFDGCSGDEGCLGVVIGVVLTAAAVAAAFLVVELVLPLVFFLLYWLVLKAIARVVNDRHACSGNLPRALLFGGLWATAYMLPLAFVVLVVHAVLAARGHHV